MKTNTKPILLIRVPMDEVPPEHMNNLMEEMRLGTESLKEDYYVLLSLSKVVKDFDLRVLNPNNTPEELETVENLIEELNNELKK